MTIQWTFVAAFLYAEIAVICVLLLPFISPTIWQSIFRSRLCNFVADKANFFFTIILAVLVLFFLDSIREMRKYSSVEHDYTQLGAEMQVMMKLFRAQRNFYIAGFALFLSLVIRRLVTLLSKQASLLVEGETARKEAQSSTELSQRLLREKEEVEKSAKEAAENYGNIREERHKEEMNKLQQSLSSANQEFSTVTEELHTAKKRSEVLSKEYDDLLSEYNKLVEQNAELRKSADSNEVDQSEE